MNLDKKTLLTKASTHRWLVWTFSSGTMSRTVRHLSQQWLFCQNDSLLSPSPRHSVCRPKRVASPVVFRSSCSALLIFELSHKTSPHLLSHGAYLPHYLVRCHHPTAGGSVGVFWVVMISFQLQLSLRRWRTHKRRRKRRFRCSPLATRDANYQTRIDLNEAEGFEDNVGREITKCMKVGVHQRRKEKVAWKQKWTMMF